MGHRLILNLLGDAGATNLAGSMTCAGWSGHFEIVNTLVERSRPVAYGAAFVGALAGLRKDMVDHVVHMADKEGLDRCLLLGAARIWSCRTLEEANFLLYAIESLVKAGAKNFQIAMQISCGDALIDYWNCRLFRDKARILRRIVVLGSPHLTADFHGRILLMICVTFLSKLIKSEEKVSRRPCGPKKNHCETGETQSCESIVQDMLNILSVVCKNGAADLISSRLLEISDASIENVRSLLHITQACCSTEWPLKMLMFLLVDCGIKDLSATVTVLSVFQAARLNVMFPVVKCFLELQCFEAVYVYLDISITFCQMDAVGYLLFIIPRPLDKASVVQAVRAAASNTRGPPRGTEGVVYALHSNFLDDERETLVEAAMMGELPETDKSVKNLLRKEWSQEAFEAGVQTGKRHFLNWMLVKKRTQACLRVRELPLEVQVAIVYLPLFKECSETLGSLLSQKKRGELVTAVTLLYQGSGKVTAASLLNSDKQTLLSFLAARLPDWCTDVRH